MPQTAKQTIENMPEDETDDSAGNESHLRHLPFLACVSTQSHRRHLRMDTHAGVGYAGAGTPTAAAGGYVYLRNRWYDPQTGRFLSQDPIGLAGGVNLYAYAGNNPTSYSDPFGLCPDGCVLESATAVAAVGAGLLATGYALQHGAELGDALEEGYEAGRDLVVGIWNAVSAKVLERQANGQVTPVEDHLGKLANPNQPGGNDPRNRDKWKNDARKALNRLRKVIDKMKGKQRE